MNKNTTKLDLVPAAADDCASVLKVLADDTRLAVVELLMKGPMSVSEINDELQIEQTLLSHHLRTLRNAGLVTTQREGKHVMYSLAKLVQASRRGRAINLGCCKISFD